MDAYLLTNGGDFDADPWQPLRELSEHGLGFQFVEIPDDRPTEEEQIPSGHYLVFNAELFVPADAYFAQFEPEEASAQPPPAYPSYEAYLHSLKPHLKSRLPKPNLVSPLPPTTLIISTRTTAGEVYWRLSAYASDRRITVDNELVKGSYVTTASDIEVVGSGFAAVGRYALPNPFPAVFAYAVRPDPGTTIDLGTVRPNYHQAGGGVEGMFGQPSGLYTVQNHRRVLPTW